MGKIPMYLQGDICTYHSAADRPASVHDGKRCKVVEVVPQDQWTHPDMPRYIISFFDQQDERYGVREAELSPEPWN